MPGKKKRQINYFLKWDLFSDLVEFRQLHRVKTNHLQ